MIKLNLYRANDINTDWIQHQSAFFTLMIYVLESMLRSFGWHHVALLNISFLMLAYFVSGVCLNSNKKLIARAHVFSSSCYRTKFHKKELRI